MYCVVLDPGVLIVALISSKGAPRALLQAWMDGASNFWCLPTFSPSWPEYSDARSLGVAPASERPKLTLPSFGALPHSARMWNRRPDSARILGTTTS